MKQEGRKRGPKSNPKPVTRLKQNSFPAPGYLSVRAKQIWQKVEPSLSIELTEATAPLLASWCHTVETIEDCTMILDREGRTVLNGVGTPVLRAEAKLLQESQRLLLSYSRSLGIVSSGDEQDKKQSSRQTALDHKGGLVDYNNLSWPQLDLTQCNFMRHYQ